MRNQRNENADLYIGIWISLFHALLGWSEERVMDWVEDTKKAEYLSDPQDIFFHESPQYWAVVPLIPESLRARLRGLDLVRLESRLREALNAGYAGPNPPPDWNWESNRQKVQAILAEYGESLPKSL